MMRLLIIFFSFFFIQTCFSQAGTAELAIARIQYVYKVKKAVGNRVWPSFGNNKYNIPIIYFAGDTTFIANPHPKFIKQFTPVKIFQKKDLVIYRVDYRLDTVRLRMLTTINFGPDTSLYDYNAPYMKCNSREELIQVTPFKPDTRGWVNIIMHEFFHGFQFLHNDYRQLVAQNNLIYSAMRDPLQNLFDSEVWYRDLAGLENELLLKANRSTDRKQSDSLVIAFFKTRNERRSRIQANPDYNIAFVEKTYETMEGCARFIESRFISVYIKDKRLAAIDSAFKYKRNANIQSDIDSLGMITTGDYYYATGYNIVRLLKKWNIPFTSILFKQPTATLEDILWQSIGKSESKIK
jgi:hypothetical protein